ncbi:hypothetical protein THMIRHAS_06570 [Thiosulfatimonas sediminis]|uniref:Cysteinyl-tRNA synthetase n=1 Tax=Thiosulfatimonas sediminis TaxID=2675054 RepID=A0A6F8PTD2_9GAMM|nr:hypothetical protein [Thiosulfatimonas sediminis]BBP45284.1 hypothetical protein THMIRHAS_06570 [Thiosulfatimonas sediminis]
MAIATRLTEGRLTFQFSGDADSATKYDDWLFYRNQFNSAFGGTKAVDIVFVDASQTWLIEVKDYRAHRRTKTIDLGEEVALKVRDTLGGLAAAKSNATDADEKRFARKALAKHRFRVVLHIEQSLKKSKLFPKAVDVSKVQLKLKQWLKALDAHPSVVDKTSLKATMPWTVV